MKIAMGSDHGGYNLKSEIFVYLKRVHIVKDFGTFSERPCDYPKVAYRVAKSVRSGKYKRGILVCTSGIGMTIVANKVKGIRAALCNSKTCARLSRQHNDANILVLSGKFTSLKKAKEIVDEWLSADFLGGKVPRYTERIEQIKEIEEKEK
ncbi:ribose 5-phosphate isomerase B [bacterium Unc6]|nr:ribose 5-phosphate isomerase B [bacterium Unc6]